MFLRSRRLQALLAMGCCLFIAAGAFGCGTSPEGAQPPENLRVDVLETLDHDSTAFTQGFEIAQGTLYESTGRVGESEVRATDLETDEQVARQELPEPLFGEGITVVDETVWHLTWEAGIAIERDRATLEERRRVDYEGEGWGLCHQESSARLVMSDGSDTLTFRDPETFDVLGEVSVRAAGDSIDELNELECVGDVVYANVWQTDTIMRIDADSGQVTGEIDASGLLTPEEEADANVLNGIAAIPDTDEFLLTGKLWPSMFRVNFVPVD